MSAPSSDVIAWVADHILPNEASIRRWLRRQGVPAMDIDDLLQEAYCKLLELPSVHAIERPAAYFCRVVRNLHLGRIRRASVVRFEPLKDSQLSRMKDDGADLEAQYEAKSQLALVLRLFSILPERCRSIFQMRRIEGLSQREIAARLGVSESVVENEAAKGLRLILQALKEDPAGGQVIERSDHRGRGKRSSRMGDQA